MKLREFECDTCRKRSEPVNEEHAHNAGQEVFPYSNGWIFLCYLDAKVDKNALICDKEKHFCSKDCALKYFDAILELAHMTAGIKQNERDNMQFQQTFKTMVY